VVRHYGGIFDYDLKKERLEEVLRELEDPAIWNDQNRAQAMAKEKGELENVLNVLEGLSAQIEDAQALLDLAVEADDESLLADVQAELDTAEEELAKLEFRRMFSNPMDPNPCYVEIQASGVHRLVRKSPFDSGNRRHTSFSAVFVSPEVDDNIEIEINPADVRTDTYRASGAGGQHINKTDSAVRLTHAPTGIVVACQNQRSQHANRDHAWKQLRAKLYELEMQKRNDAAKALEDTKSDIGWGSQIRSYVLDDSRIKDLRTGVENSNTGAVLDGDLDKFIEASLKQGL